MADLSQINSARRIPATIPGDKYLLDHAFADRAVLPAVEAMQMLAAVVGKHCAGVNVRNISAARFDKFLPLETEAHQIEVVITIDTAADGTITAELLTKSRVGRTQIKRTRSHARIGFPTEPSTDNPLPYLKAIVLPGKAKAIESDRIYRDLVPFGPAYHNISGALTVAPEGAIAKIRSPNYYSSLKTNSHCLGSPFVLDAAFHAACVWGQRFKGIVAFPVAFQERIIYLPPSSQSDFTARIIPTTVSGDQLTFDIWIYAETGQIIESARGVRMRDVSGGRWKPPQWIRKG